MGLINTLISAVSGKSSSSIPEEYIDENAKKVLVVEADEAQRSIFFDIFKTQGYNTKAVTNGAEGLNELLVFKPDLIFMDLILPVMDGKAMLHHLRALPQYKTTPVIVIADIMDPETIHQIKTFENASAFFIKSNTSSEDIIKCTRELL